MAKASRLQVEIDAVERDIKVLAQVGAHMAKGSTPESIAAEMSVLEKVYSRLIAALPPAKDAAAPVVKRVRKAKKKDGE